MLYNKLYQYKGVTKQSAFVYTGTLGVRLNDDTQYDVLTPVNTTANRSLNEDVVVVQDTLSNQTD